MSNQCSPVTELAIEYHVHPTQITCCKQDLIENASDLFGKGKKNEVHHDVEVAELFRLIGKLKVDLEYDNNSSIFGP